MALNCWTRSAVLAFAFAVVGCDSSTGPVSSPTETPTPSPATAGSSPATDGLPAAELTAESRTYPIPYAAGSVGVSGGAVWVIPHLNPVVVRIDPESGTTRSFELPGIGAELAATDGELWVSLSEPDSFQPLALARIDPATGNVTARMDEALTFPAVAGDHLFAADQSSLQVFDRKTQAPVDVATGDIGTLVGWRAVADHVWLVGTDRAVRIDAKTLETDDVTKQLRDDVPLALAGGRYWARTPDGGLASYAPDLSDRRMYDIPGTVFPDAAVIGDDLYVAVLRAGDQGASMLVRIDTSLDKPVSAVTMPEERQMEYGIDSDGTCLWVPILRTPEVYRACPSP